MKLCEIVYYLIVIVSFCDKLKLTKRKGNRKDFNRENHRKENGYDDIISSISSNRRYRI